MSVPTSPFLAYAEQRRASLGKSVDAELHVGVARAFSGEVHPYVTRALGNVCGDLAAMSDGAGRNTYLNDQLWRFVGYAAAGHIDEATVLADLRDAARVSGLGDLEVRKVFRGDSTGAITNGRATPLDPPPMSAQQAERYGRPAVAPALGWVPPDVDADTGELLQAHEPQPTTEAGEQVPGEDELERRRLEVAVAQELRTQRVRREATRLLDEEEHARAFREPPSLPSLTDYLAVPPNPQQWAVERLVPARANVLLTAAFKAGKTTTVSNLAAAFADDEPFLGRFAVSAPSTGRIALWNYEVDGEQYVQWLRDVDIAHPDRVALLNLRGYTLPLTVPRVAAWCVSWLLAHDVRWWVVDPFARAFGGMSENDNAEVTRWLDAVDAIKEQAGVDVLVLPTHTGRAEFEPGAERARGATRLDDWADVRWLLTRDEGGNRFLRATGRDVEVEEEQLTFDPTSRRLLMGGHDRAGLKRRSLEDAVVAVVTDTPGIGVRDLRQRMRDGGHGGRNERLDAAIAAACRYRRISIEDRGTQGVRHYPITAPVAFVPPILGGPEGPS